MTSNIVLTILIIGGGIAVLAGAMVAFGVLATRREDAREEIEDEQSRLIARQLNEHSGEGDLPRVPEEDRLRLEQAPPPEGLQKLKRYVGQELVWDRAQEGTPRRYTLHPAQGEGLLGVLEWATSDPIFAVAWIDGRGYVLERRGDYDRPRVRVYELGAHERLMQLKPYKSRVKIGDDLRLIWRTPGLSQQSHFEDEGGQEWVRFDLSAQRDLRDNRTYVTITPAADLRYAGPLAALGFFDLTLYP